MNHKKYDYIIIISYLKIVEILFFVFYAFVSRIIAINLLHFYSVFEKNCLISNDISGNESHQFHSI